MIGKCRRTGLLAGIGIAALAGAGPANADSLREALARAYATNPTLMAARAQQRAIDEGVPIERAAGLPSASADISYNEYLEKGNSSFASPDRSLNGQLQLNVPVYSGGAVKNSVRAAKTRVAAGQADLRGTESAIFSQVVAAYMDVILQEAVVNVRRNQVDVLTVNLQATSDRFEIGDLTRTDVAQSQARLALAESDARTAEANLAGARETYIRLVGVPPGDLDPPPPLPNLPASAEQAVLIALENNPDIIAAKQRSEASRYDVEVAGAGRLPRVSLYGQGAYSDNFGTGGTISGITFADRDKSAQVGAQVSIPLFQGGRPAALRRQAQAQTAAALETEIAIERDVIAQARSAFATWVSSQKVIESSQEAVQAASLSLEGVRAENTVGNRTVLDILDAEQELIVSQVSLLTARRNAYVAAFTLLAAMGRAEARDLGLDGGALYDPQDNYDRVRGKWFDWDTDPMPQVLATRTVDTPVQGGEASTVDSQQGQ